MPQMTLSILLYSIRRRQLRSQSIYRHSRIQEITPWEKQRKNILRLPELNLIMPDAFWMQMFFKGTLSIELDVRQTVLQFATELL